MTDPERRAGWIEYQELVLSELKNLKDSQDKLEMKLDAIKDQYEKRLSAEISRINERITENQISIATLKAQTAIIGCVASAVMTAVINHFAK